MKQFLVILFFCTIFIGLKAQVVLDGSLTVQELIEQVLVSDGVSISNVSYQGNKNLQVAAFTDNSANYGFTEGLYMTSGRASEINQPAIVTADQIINLGSGDGDLARLLGVNRNSITDAFIIEFDFVPNGDSVSFKYVFASEEYPDYVCSEFNDGFGFFLSGPGISGPYSNNGKNIALIPGTNTEVSINNVNGGSPGIDGIVVPCNLSNSNFYISNAGGSTVYNGRTVIFEARSSVTCGETYHIKLAIADILDGQFDSGVFLEANSFNSTNINLNFDGAAFNANSNQATEGCHLNLTFSRPPSDTTNTVYLPLSWEGSATPNVDYVGHIDTIEFPPGIDTIRFPIDILLDFITEPEENIEVKILTGNCGGAGFTFEILINDPLPISLGISDTLVIGCEDSVQLDAQITGGTNNFVYQWTNDQGQSIGTDSLSDWLTAEDQGNYSVWVYDSCSRDTAVSYFFIQKEIAAANANFSVDNSVFCVSDTILIRNLSTDANAYQWSINGSTVSFEPIPSLVFSDTGLITIGLIVQDSLDCYLNDTFQLSIFVSDSAYADFIVDDYCPNENNTASSIDQTAGNTYQWQTSTGLTGTQSEFNFAFTQSGTADITLAVVNAAGCSDQITQTVNILDRTVVEANFNLPNNRYCQNTAVMPANISVNATDFIWYSGNGDTTTSVAPTFTYADTGSYTITLIASSTIACSNIDTFQTTIKVESVTANFATDTLCQYQPYSFVSIDNSNVSVYSWTIDGVVSSGSNPFITNFDLPGNYTIELTITNDIGCMSSITKSVTVMEQPIADFSNDDICVGKFTSFDNLSTGAISSYLWNFDDGSLVAYDEPDHIFRDSGLFNIQLIAFAQYCPSDTMTKSFRSYFVPDLFLGDDLALCLNEEKVLTIPDSIVAQLDYLLWHDGSSADSFTATIETPVISVTGGVSSCTKSDELLVTEKCDVYAPSAFSPNNDGINDYFNALDENIASYTLYVFDRWGQELFVTSDFNYGWDGRQNGQKSPMDVYTYTISGVKIDGSNFQSSGSFLLLR
ncbi:MAG: choice-of-anchor L domain-containing protein [Chitinophagales bacterium]